MKHKGCGGNIRISQVPSLVAYTDERGDVRTSEYRPLVCSGCNAEITCGEQVEYVVSQE